LARCLAAGFLANGELESAYFEWKAALARIDRAATWPNSNATVSFSYMFSRENIKAWNRTTISGGLDPSVVLSLPVKTQAAGEVALEAAREASEKFRTVKFDLQKRVLLAYLDLELTEEKVRIQRDNLNLLKLVADSAAARSQAGGSVVPSVQQLINASQQDYAAGTVGFADLIDSERTYVGVRLMVAQARIEREKRLAELEALAGVDIETLGYPATQASSLSVQ
jgi:outer membrane protein TolC